MRVCVQMSDGAFAVGDLKHTTVDGKYVVHLDGECAEHTWDDVEFFENAN